jgi:very-short-patch-repair endonuclease
MNDSLPRRLRRNATDAEKALWRLLRDRALGGAKFRRQCPIGRYVADFACLGSRLVVEADGGQPANSVRNVEEPKQRGARDTAV